MIREALKVRISRHSYSEPETTAPSSSCSAKSRSWRCDEHVCLGELRYEIR